MIEHFFDELQRNDLAANKAANPPEKDEKLHSEPKAGESFLAVLPTIRKIVWSKLFSARRTDAPDILQKVILQLLTWRENNPNKIEEMSDQEWQSFASKATYRAVNRRLAGKENLLEPLLDKAFEISSGNLIVGNTVAEVASLTLMFWQGICQLSLRQRRALLLGSESLLVILRIGGIANRDLSEVLELSESELLEIINRLPFKDAQIAQLIAVRSSDAQNKNVGSLAKSIKKARHEARAKLRKLISK